MAKIDCFKGIKIAGLQEEFEKRISEGMSDTQLRDIGTQVALEQFNKLDADLVKLKKSIGQKAKAQNLTYEPKQVENETKEQQEEPLLEGVQDGGKQNETGQESPELRTEETQEVEPQTQEADALQQVQRETEESVLRDEQVEETSQEEVEQQTQTPQEEKIESPKNKRRFAARAQEAAKTSKQKVLDRPEFYYTPQQLNEVKGEMQNMTDEELTERMGDDSLLLLSDGSDNFSVLAGVELLKRKIDRGEDASELVGKLAQRGTAIAQLLRQFAELKSSTPEGFYAATKAYLDSQGADLTGAKKKETKATRKARAKDLASRIRKAKFVKTVEDMQNLRSDPTGLFKAAWDGSVEAVALSIEAGATIADAVEAGINKLRESDWFNGLSDEGKEQAEQLAKDGFKKQFEEVSPQEAKLQRLSTEYMQSIQELNSLGDAYLQDYNSVSPKQIKEAQRNAEKKLREFDRFMNQVLPKTWGDLLSQIIQGNLLTPTSQIVNITANIGQVFLNAAVDLTAEGVRKSTVGIANVLGRPVSSESMVPLFDMRAYTHAARQGVQGVREAFKAIIKGTKSIDNNFEYQMNRGIMPLRAFYASISGTKLGDLFGVPQDLLRPNMSPAEAFNERAKKFVEATLGIPAEAMFRLLNLGDAPFYRFAQGKEVYLQAKASGLKGENLEAFLKYPSKEMLEKSEKRAKEAVFQEESTISKGVQDVIRKAEKKAGETPLIGDMLQFFIRTQVPYVRTPTNIILQTIDFAIPPVSIYKAFTAARKGDTRRMSEFIGKAVVGVALAKTAEFLIANDVITGSLRGDDDEREREKRERGLAYETLPPNTINASGLARLLQGGDPAPQEGDEYLNYTKLGIPSVILGIYVNSDDKVRRAKQKKGRGVVFDKSDFDNLLFGWEQIPETFQVSLEQSFLSGTNALLNAISGGEYEVNRWVTSTFRAASTVALPNTLSSLNRTQVEYYPDLRSDDLETQIINVIKDRTFNTDDLPARVDLSGEPILMTPEGENPYIYHLFDVTKGASVQNAERWLKLRDLYFDTQEYKVIPTMPKRTISNKKYKEESIRLSYPNYNEFAAEVQKMKMDELDKVINNRRYDSWDDEKKIERIKRAYEKVSRSRDYKKLREKYIELTKKEIDQRLNEEN